MYVTEPCAQRAHTHLLMYNFCWIIFPKFWQFISNKNLYLKKCTFPNPAAKGFTETLQLTYIYPNCWHDISNTNIYIYFVIFIFVFRFAEYMSVVFIYWCWIYHTNNWGNVSVGGFLCARECTFCNVYICIGYMLPTFGEYTSVEGFLCALRAQS